MRRWMNQVKMALLLRELPPGSVTLEVGSGRFGDLAKWNKAGLSKVYCIEPSDENRAEALRRYAELRKRAPPEIPEYGPEPGYVQEPAPAYPYARGTPAEAFSSTFGQARADWELLEERRARRPAAARRGRLGPRPRRRELAFSAGFAEPEPLQQTLPRPFKTREAAEFGARAEAEAERFAAATRGLKATVYEAALKLEAAEKDYGPLAPKGGPGGAQVWRARAEVARQVAGRFRAKGRIGAKEEVQRAQRQERRWSRTEVQILNTRTVQETDSLARELKGKTIDAVVAFFSLTYVAQSEQTFYGCIESIAAVLRDGGKLLVTVLSGHETQALLDREREAQGLEAGETVVVDNACFRMEQRAPAGTKATRALPGEPSLKAGKRAKKGKAKVAEVALEGPAAPKARAATLAKRAKGKEKGEPAEEEEEEAEEGERGAEGKEKGEAAEEAEAAIIGTGREIQVTLKDPEVAPENKLSMVKDQTEWLFDEVRFVAELEARGFVMSWPRAEARQLMVRLGGTKNYEALPGPSQAFSVLNTAFVMVKRPLAAPKLVELEYEVIPNFGQTVPMANVYDQTLKERGVDQDSSAFLAAALFATDPAYRETADKEDRARLVAAKRRELAKALSVERFQQLMGGKLAVGYARRFELLGATKVQARVMAYDYYKTVVSGRPPGVRQPGAPSGRGRPSGRVAGGADVRRVGRRAAGGQHHRGPRQGAAVGLFGGRVPQKGGQSGVPPRQVGHRLFRPGRGLFLRRRPGRGGGRAGVRDGRGADSADSEAQVRVSQ